MEKDTIDFNRLNPNTVDSLKSALKDVGLEKNMNIVVHSSLSKLGWVCGGPVAVIDALKEIITCEGTIVMPSHTGELSEPSYWENPPVPESWWDTIRDTMPPFDREFTPTRAMGSIAETFRTGRNTLRSSHPQCSFSAWGRNSSFITEGHSLDFPLGDNNPLSKLYELDGHILLLGVDFDRNTSLHLCEFRCKKLPTIKQGAPIKEDGRRVWKTFDDVDYSPCDFKEIGRDFISEGLCRPGKVGEAQVYLMKIRDLVDFGTCWMKKNIGNGDER